MFAYLKLAVSPASTINGCPLTKVAATPISMAGLIRPLLCPQFEAAS
jgi:hypothetical protein